MNSKKMIARGPFLVLLLVSCVMMFGFSTSGLAEEKEVLIASILPMAIEPGLHVLNGRILAVEEINADGGIKSMGGAKVKLINRDNQMKPEVAVAEAERFMRSGVKIIAGPFMSQIGLVLSQFADKNKVLLVITNCVAKEITSSGFKYVFRHHFNNEITAKNIFMAYDEISEKAGLPIKTIAFLYEDSIWGTSAAKFSAVEAKARGWNIVQDLKYARGLRDATLLVTKLKAANPDLLMACNYVTDDILIMKTMAEQKYYVKGILSLGSGMMNPSFIEQLGKSADYWSGSAPSADNPKLPGISDVNQAYKKRYGKAMPDLAVLGYHGIMALREALEIAGSDDPDKLRQAYLKMNVPPGQKGNHNHYAWRFDETGQNPEAQVMISQIINGELETIWPFDYAEADFIFPIPPWEKR